MQVDRRIALNRTEILSKRFIQTFLKALGPYGRRIWCKMYVIGSSTDEWQSYGAESTNQKSGFWFVKMLKQKTQSEFERKTIVTGEGFIFMAYFFSLHRYHFVADLDQ